MAPGAGLEGEARETGLRKRVEGAPEPPGSLVLVVDDMDDHRELYALALRAAGFRVMRARDGHEAVRVARDWLPDLVVMDYSMPRMNGAQAMGLLAAEPSTARIPVVMISAFADDVPRGARLRCAAFVAKPCLGDDLVRVVRRVIDD